MRLLLLYFALSALSTVASATVPIGTIALYSDGRIEKLIAIEENGLRWEDDRMRQFLRSTNPIIPVLESRQLITGRGYTQRLRSGDPASIKQVPEGTPVRFTTVRSRDGGIKTQYWTCEYLGASVQDVLTVARTLERYRCQRFSFGGKIPRYRLRDTSEFTFSPELGVMFKIKRETATDTRSRELEALFAPGSADHKTLSRKVRKVRER